MIRRLTLKNWRSYEAVTVDFTPGTTFVVASNGVGKTSLVEGARWALFGRIAPGGQAVRAGTTAALATVELELPDQRILTVERTLTNKPRQTPPVAHLDGAPLSEQELHQQLSKAYRTESTFLAGLTMPAADRGSDKPAALGLEEHLGHYYGINGLRTAIGQLEAMRKANDAQIKRIKTANSTSVKLLAQLRSDVEETARRVVDATSAHKSLQTRVDTARKHERFEVETRKWQEDNAAWHEAVRQFAAHVSADLGLVVSPESVDYGLAHQLDEVGSQLEALRVDIGVNESKAMTLTTNDERLDTAHDDCPVCRRPLDTDTVASAHEANMREISSFQEVIRDLKAAEAELLAQRKNLKATQSEWRRIPKPPTPPQPPTAGTDEPMTVTQLGPLAEQAFNALVTAQADHQNATQALEQAQAADEAMHELESLFKRDAGIIVAIKATKSTLAQLLNDTIRPLASEVGQRWKALFPDRGDLNTDATGEITRTVNGLPLPYDCFSTGEGMGVTILMRLLVAQMATTADFCWFDEPLEHLDPDVRRRVGNLLARATSGEGQLRQIVVTTYEEPLARQLQARDKQKVTLIDVRQAS